MMHPFPFLGPSYFRKPYPYHYYRKPSYNYNNNYDISDKKPYFPNISQKKEQKNFDSCSNNMKNKNFDDNNIEKTQFNNEEYNNEEIFEIFGLKLHFDDLLIITLLFFLYQEDVKDTYLYIALILLLLS